MTESKHMSSDVRRIVYLTLIGFLLMLAVWFGLLFVVACDGTIACNQGQPISAIRTPIPTLIPATMPAPQAATGPVVAKCQVGALDLLRIWVSAGTPEKDPFDFEDVNGLPCKGTFVADIQPLFRDGNLWYQGAPACTTCHYADLALAQKNMDLSSYAGILAGAERISPDVKGKDILGGGNWEQSLLYARLTASVGGTLIPMPLGRPEGVDLAKTIIFAGAVDVARPSNEGGPGDALKIKGEATAGQEVFAQNCVECHGQEGTGGVVNNGSTDGTVPPLNPIDPTLVSADYATFAYNLDLFLQHGSTPEGNNPEKSMPAWGDQNKLTQQQIADVIAYLISLNKK